MKCNLTVLFIIAAALVVVVFAWIAAAQGSSSDSCGSTPCDNTGNVWANQVCTGSGAWYD